ncbi:LacI family DNA-binding transcriptional regulator [Paenibacillus sp.]|uniref:LacI family DNA-binding transcriptional regulator n=1 Tax=Paenibacillus sp. TaxID=58172 RepID=UPI002D367B4F|nr:substrate-binding domain-containing protein [Paenibacillus sp.]HZG87962.1 substrate-binding domain-containing protein [Paenibacillus sp.]
MPRVKMEDIAKMAGVSKSTVSQYLNKRYEFMSAETKDRIEKVIRETGYQPNTLARGLKVKRTQTIGVIVANILHYYSTAVCRGIEDYCNQHGYNVIICNADDDPGKERGYIEMLLAKQADGIICVTTGENNELLGDLVRRSYPLVLVDRKAEGIETDGVYSNNEQGAFDAVEHLIRQGHRRIALLSPEIHRVSTRRERYAGYAKAHRTHGIPLNDTYVRFVDEFSGLKALLQELLRLPEPPTALFCSNDLSTVETLRALKETGIKVPERIAIVGFDDSPWTDLLEPPLTRVVQRTFEIGARSAERLLLKIEQPDAVEPTVQIMDCELKIGGTCRFGE